MLTFFYLILFTLNRRFYSVSQNQSPLSTEIETDPEGNMKVATTASRVISCIDPLGSMPFKTLDPFLFCVYHKDTYPAGDAKVINELSPNHKTALKKYRNISFKTRLSNYNLIIIDL